MNSQDNADILVVAGETSGDLHGSLLIEELAIQNPRLNFFGIGGDEMEKKGVTLLEHVDSMAVVGITEVFKKYFSLKKTFYRVNRVVEQERPKRAILIDYPGFNLRLAKKLKKKGVPVTYYICPQLWAWRESRVEVMRRCVDQLLCILPFEEEWYRERGIEAAYVGHPLGDRRDPEMSREQFCRAHGLSSDAIIVALFPGSRQEEVDRHLPIMTEAVRLLKRGDDKIRGVLGKAPGIDVASHELSGTVVEEERPSLALRHASFGLIASGTATLEAALYGVPSVVVYRLSKPSWAVARMVTKVPFAALTNLVAGREVIPELLQDSATPERIAREVERITVSASERKRITDGLNEVRKKLGEAGATRKAASLINGRLVGRE